MIPIVKRVEDAPDGDCIGNYLLDRPSLGRVLSEQRFRELIPVSANDLTVLLPELLGLQLRFVFGGTATPSPEEAKREVVKATVLFHRLSWTDLAKQAQRLVDNIESGQDGAVLEALSNELSCAFSERLSDLRLGVIERKDNELFEDASLFLCGGRLHSDLAVSEEEINLAGRALACSLSTAAVSHAMRSVEASLHVLAPSLGIVFAAPVQLQDWKVLTDKIQSEIKKQEQAPGRSQQKTEKLTRFSQLLLPADAFRLAWRNHVAHAREKYEDSEARKVLGHVGDYLRKLSEGLAVSP